MHPRPLQTSEYFARFASLPEIGENGISKLASARVAIVGVGGTGSAIAYYLAKSGIGYLRLIDQDVVLASNLQRLHAIDESDIFKPKAEAHATRLSKIAVAAEFEPVVDTVTQMNVNQVLDNVDIVVDGLDNFRTRYIINNFAIDHKMPYVFTSSVREQFHIALFSPRTPGCLECIMPNVIDRVEENCEILGVSPLATSMTGIFAANIVANTILHRESKNEHMLTVDLAGPEFMISKIYKRADCHACSRMSRQIGERSENAFMLCGHHSANVLPNTVMNLDLQGFSTHLDPGNVLRVSTSVIVYRNKGRIVSLFRDGRVLIEGVSEKQEAVDIAREARRQATETPLIPVS